MSKRKTVPFKLTSKNYFSKDRPHVSYSMIKDFLSSPALYKKRYVLREPRPPMTDAMKFGSLVDAILTNPKEAAKYRAGKKERGSSPEEDRYRVSEDAFAEADMLAKFVRSQPFWNAGKKDYQVVVEGDLVGAQVCGMVDAVLNHADGVVLLDLKCTNSRAMASANSWKWQVLDFGYHLQAAMYCELWRQRTGILPRFVHVTACVDGNGMPRVRLYELPFVGLSEIERGISGIRKGDFDDPPVEWSGVELIQITQTYDAVPSLQENL